MTKEEARKQLAENLMLMAEALLDDDDSGFYKGDDVKGELRIKSVDRHSTTIIAIKNWNYEETDEDDWAEFIS